MDTVREGLRDGTISRGRFERLTCADCDRELSLVEGTDGVGTVMSCPECGAQWLEL